MSTQFAKAVSVLFHPFFMTIAGAMLLLWMHPEPMFLLSRQGKWAVAGLFVINTAIIPTLGIMMLKNLGMVSSLQLPERRERRWPFLIGVGAYAVTVYLLARAGMPQVLVNYMIVATLVLIAGSMINFFLKISLHGLGMGASVGVLLKLSLADVPGLLWLFPVALLLAGLVGSARLSLGAHKPIEFYLGFLTGFTIPMLFFS